MKKVFTRTLLIFFCSVMALGRAFHQPGCGDPYVSFGGTATGTTSGTGTNPFILCWGDQITAAVNGDTILPVADATNNPAFGFGLFTCAPAGNQPPTNGNDPCWSNWSVTANPQNDNNNAGSLYAGLAGAAYPQEFVLVPMVYEATMGGTFDWGDCFHLNYASAVSFTYLADITYNNVTDGCSGSVSFTIGGGYPQLSGGNYGVTNTGAGVLSGGPFTHGSTVTISGLTVGQNYSIDIANDGNGCSGNFSGTYSPALEDASFTYPSATVCSTGSDPASPNTPGGSYTFNPPPGDGASIDPSTGVITNTADGANYTVEYTTPGTMNCPNTSTFMVTGGTTPSDPLISDFNACVPSQSTEIFPAPLGGTFNFYQDPTGVFLWTTGSSYDPSPSGGSSITVYVGQQIGGCESNLVPVTVTGYDQPFSPIFPDLDNNPPNPTFTVCDGTPILNGITPFNISGSNFAFYPDGSLFPGTELFVGQTWDPSGVLPAPGSSISIFVTEINSNGCEGPSTQIEIEVLEAPEVDAGTATVDCSSPAIDLTGSVGGSAVSGFWGGGDDGTFGNANSLITTYTPGPNDIANGSVTLTLVATDPNGICNLAIDALFIDLTSGSGSVSGSEPYAGCTGDGYNVTVGSTLYNEANPSGMETLMAASGCDSIVTVNLVFNSVSTGIEPYTGCQGDGYSVTVGSTLYNEANPAGSETLTGFNGCDSVVTVNLVYQNSLTGIESYTGCDGDGYTVTVGSTLYNEANPNGTETLTAFNNCDSVVTVNLVFNSSLAGTESYTGCQGDGYSVTVGSTLYNEANQNGTETLTSVNGCDSVVTVNLVYNNSLSGTESYTGCQSDGYSVTVGSTLYNEANSSGTETLTSVSGCDSIVTVNLVYNVSQTGTEDYTGCNGDAYSVNVGGTLYNEANPSGTETLTAFNDCDSVVTVNLVYNTNVTGTESYTGCNGDGYSIAVGATTYNEANPFGTETLTAFNGCDSLVTVNLVFDIAVTGTEDYTGCNGDAYSVNVGGTLYNEANPSGTETLTSFNGCDSVVTVNLVFNTSLTGSESYTGCDGDGYSVAVGASTYNESNPIGSETLTAFNGCDSVVTVSLVFNTAVIGTESYSGCQSDGYNITVGSTLYNEANPSGTETLIAFNGCDSVVTVDLVFNSFVTGTESYSGCQGDGYTVTVGSTIYNEANPSGSETLTSVGGCDSIVSVDLTYDTFVTGTEIYTGCAGDAYSVTVNGTVYNETNTSGSETLTSIAGCDSIVTIDLTFNATMTGAEVYTGCAGDGYNVTVGSTIYNEGNPSGSETLTSFNGCDSVVTVNFTFNTNNSGTESYTGCTGDGYSVTVGTNTYNESLTNGVEVLSNINGCDSVVTVSLNFNTTSSGTETYNGCSGDDYNVAVGLSTYDEANPSGVETLTGFSGCDSIVMVDLVFNNNESGSVDYNGCTSDGYSIIIGGTTYDETNQSGVEILTSSAGCDSTVTINLTFSTSLSGIETYVGCQGDGYLVNVNGTTYSEGNPTGSETLMSSIGCDSIVSINLTYNAFLSGLEDYSGCTSDGYAVIVAGTTYNEANPTGTETLTAINGCDSIVSVNLVFNDFLTGTESYTGCQSDAYNVVVNGTSYNEANPTGTETLVASNGCDSVVSINLVFNPTLSGTELYTGCQGDGYAITINGSTYNESNPIGTETLTGFNGCDSIVSIDLFFNSLIVEIQDYIGCENDGFNIVVNGIVYDQSNPNGTEVMTNFQGCDSTVMIDLVFNNGTSGFEDYNGCQGDGYSVNVGGSIFNESNPTGSQTLTGFNGCDSIVMVDLIFNSAVSGVESYIGCQGDGFSVSVSGTIYDESNQSGIETLTGINGCDSTVFVDLVFNASVVGAEDYIGCQGDGYAITVNGSNYNESNPNGMETLTGFNGCDSVVTVDLVYNPALTESINYTGCQGDGFSITVGGTVYDETNPSGGTTLVSSTGCDSLVTVDLIYSSTVAGFENYNGCEGDGYSVIINGTNYNEANPSGTETLMAFNGCDSVVTVNLLYNAFLTGIENHSGCIGDGYSVNVNGTIYNESNPTGTETLISSIGCDSIVSVDLTFDTFVSSEVSNIGCDGDGFSVLVNGTMYDQSNTSGMETVPGGSIGGCDSVITVDLTFLLPQSVDLIQTLCEGSFLNVNGAVYNESNPNGMEIISGAAFNGCDSIVNVSLDFFQPAVNNFSQTLCFGQSININGETYNETNPDGIQVLSGASINGCDSTMMIQLDFAEAVVFDLDATICQEDEIIVDNQTFNFSNPQGSVIIPNGSISGCDSIVNVNLDFVEPLTASIQGDGAVCAGNSAELEFILEGSTAYDIEYTDGFNTFILSDIQSGHLINVNPAFNTTYTLINVTAAGNNCAALFPNATIDVEINRLEIDAVVNTDYFGYGVSCEGSEDGAIAALAAVNGQEPYSYSWSTGATSQMLENLGAGEYLVTTTDAIGCISIDSVTIYEPEPFDIFLEVNEVTCFGENDGLITVDSVDGGFGPYMYSIDNGPFIGFPQFSNLSSGTYDIMVQDANGCETEENLIIGTPTEVLVDLGEDIVITLGESVELNAQVNIPEPLIQTLIWEATDTIPCENCLLQLVTPIVTTSYSIMVMDENGCMDEDEMVIVVENDRPVFVPSAFSPNGDGNNDILFLNADEAAIREIKSFLIFDRWGEIVFEANPVDFEANTDAFGWDGTLKGQSLDPAVFVYWLEIEFIDGATEIFKGDITLIR